MLVKILHFGKKKEDFVRYGRYFGISCYPKDVVKDLEILPGC